MNEKTIMEKSEIINHIKTHDFGEIEAVTQDRSDLSMNSLASYLRLFFKKHGLKGFSIRKEKSTRQDYVRISYKCDIEHDIEYGKSVEEIKKLREAIEKAFPYHMDKIHFTNLI